MKYIYILKISILSCFISNSSLITAQEKVNSGIYINYDIVKSLFHLGSGGYSLDFEGLYIIPDSNFGISLNYGHTKYHRGEISRANIQNFTAKGYYFKPQFNFIIPKTVERNFIFSLGLILSNYSESLQPRIPGNYYNALIGETITRSNINTIGGDIRISYHFIPKSKFSFILTSGIAIINSPKLPQNIMIDELEPLYVPGVGIMAGSLSFNLGFKISYRLFPIKN